VLYTGVSCLLEMRREFALVLTILALLSSQSLVDAAKQRTLVLLDNSQIRSTHSTFFGALKAQGHELTFVEAYENDSPLQKYGDYFYENLIMFAPSAEDFGEAFGGPEAIIRFIDSGRNVLIAVNSSVSEPLREVANECGIDFDESETSVIDHVSFDAALDEGHHTVVASNHAIVSSVVLGKGPSAPVLFSGVGHAYSAPNAESSPLLYKVLVGSSSSYSHQPSQRVKSYPQSAGLDTLLVSAIQTRNNARVVFAGSLDLFSNKFFCCRCRCSWQEICQEWQ